MLYISNKNTNPYFNLAMEEYLLDLNDNNDYFLLWQNEPTIVIGRYQNTIGEINAEYVKKNNIHVVRRITGGGAVYHDLGNLNYSFIIKSSEKIEFDFRKYTLPIIEILRKMGIKAELSGRNDITIDQKKISGNAQCVRKNRILHHGTLLFNSKIDKLSKALKVTEDKFQSKGVKSVRARVTNISEYIPSSMSIPEFKQLLLKNMFDYNVDMVEHRLGTDDLNQIYSLMKNKYMSWDWNYGHSPEFNIKREKRFTSGKIEVQLNVKDGIINNIKFYGDFFFIEDPENIEALLTGRRYREDEIRSVLDQYKIDYYFKGITMEELMSCII